MIRDSKYDTPISKQTTGYPKLFIALAVLWLLPFVATSFFNQPAIDDYWNANVVNTHGKWGAVVYFYQTVSARYFSHLIMSFCNTLPEGNVWIFKAWPVITILFLFVAFYFFYRSVFGEKIPVSQIIFLSLLFVVLHIANMRSLFEGLYWMSSTVCYQLAIGLFAINIGAIIKDIKKPQPSTKIIAIVSCFLLPGTVEMMIPVYIITLCLRFYFSYRLHYPKTIVFSCLIITIILTAFIAFSKGNLERIKEDNITYHPQLFMALFYSARSAGYYTIVWLLNPLNILALMLIFSSKKAIAIASFRALQKREKLILFICFLLVSIAVYLPLHLFESAIPFPRITTLFFFVFFHICVAVVGYFSFQNIEFISKLKSFAYKKPVRIALFVLFFIAAFSNKNFVLVCKDLFTETDKKYNEESYQRYKLIEDCKSDTCYVPLHKNWPYFVQSSAKESSDSTYFQHMNVYYKKTILFR